MAVVSLSMADVSLSKAVVSFSIALILLSWFLFYQKLLYHFQWLVCFQNDTDATVAGSDNIQNVNGSTHNCISISNDTVPDAVNSVPEIVPDIVDNASRSDHPVVYNLHTYTVLQVL